MASSQAHDGLIKDVGLHPGAPGRVRGLPALKGLAFSSSREGTQSPQDTCGFLLVVCGSLAW